MALGDRAIEAMLMDLSGVDVYWLDQRGRAPPPALDAFKVRTAPPTPGASAAPAVAFLAADAQDPLAAAREIRASLGDHAYVILVAALKDDDAVALIGCGLDEVCAVEALARPQMIMARAVAQAKERFRSGKRSAEAERRYSQLQAGLDTLPTPIFIKDAEAIYIGCNSAFAAFMGRPSEEIIGKGVYEVAPPALAKTYDEADRRLLRDGGIQIYEARVRPTGDQYRDVMFHKAVYRDGDGSFAGMIGVMLDISQRKRAETALHDSEERYRDVFDNVSDCITLVEVTPEGRFKFLAINPAVLRASGLAESEFVGKFVEEALPPPTGAAFVQRLGECVASGAPARYETSFDGPFGRRLFLCNLIPVAGAGGSIQRVIAVARDVTDEREVERIRHEREREFRALVDNSPDSIMRYDRACRCIFANHVTERAGSPDEVLGKTPVESVLFGDVRLARVYQDWLLEVMRSGVPDEREITTVGEGGQMRISTVRVIPERGPDGEVASVLTIGADTHDRSSAERLLRQREQEFRTLVENSPDLIARYDAQCRRLYVNPAIRNYIGGDNLALGALPATGQLLKPEEFTDKLREVIALRLEREFECAYRAVDGSIKWCHVRLVPEFDQNDKVASVLSIGRDITEIVESRRKIQHLAFYDSLTGLPNRSLLSERIAHAAARSEGRGGFALMLLDLDRFKEVNDTFGHAVGDALLRQVAARLRRSLRRSDTIARLGGDEFAILLPYAAQQRNFGAIATKLLRALDRPFHIAGREIIIFGSLGIAENRETRVDTDTLFKHADTAMYHAKRMGRNNFQFFTPEMTARNVWRMAIETNLRKARGRGELELFFQPRVSLRSQKILGAEALLRWRHSELGFLTPDKFIDVAEDTGLIVEIGEWVLAEACAQALEWNQGGETCKVSVNLSSRQFVMNDLVGSLREILNKSGCDPHWLELEITESLLLEDNQTVRSMLHAISKMGITIAIDDFGTGFSALSYLTRFPIDTLKIDRSFISDVDRDRKRAELVKAIIAISTALELKLVAEGVENEAQAEFLRRSGCEEAQGYLYGKPMQASDFAEHLYGKRAISAAVRPSRRPAIGA